MNISSDEKIIGDFLFFFIFSYITHVLIYK